MINLTKVNFAYGKMGLFDNLSLRAESGNIYGVLGRNGAGKSTLFHLLCGLLFPCAGECSVMGFKPSQRNPDFLADLFLVPEKFTIPKLSGREYESLYGPFYPRYSSSRLKELLKMFEIDGDERLDKLSFGQQKKFLLAFAFACDTRLLLLDEPTNGLDIPSKGQFRRILATFIDDDKTILISTHQARDLEDMIDPVIILDEGKIIFNHTLEKVSRSLTLEFSEQLSEDDEILYSEKTLGGYSLVKINKEQADSETQIDLECLFNTVIANPHRISEIFKNGGAA